MEKEEAKREIIRAARYLYKRGFVAGSGGNISLRIKNGCLITATGTSFRELRRDQITHLNMKGERLEGPLPSSEWRMHLALLALEGIKAVCHIHGIYSIAHSITCEPSEDVLPPITPGLLLAGPLPLLPQLLPGSQALAEEVFSKLKETGARAILLKNHGLVCVGKDLSEALNLSEEIEAGLKLYFLVKDHSCLLKEDMVLEIRRAYKVRD